MNNKRSFSQDSSGANSIEELVQQVIQTLLKSRQTLSFAESCTGGMLSARIAEVPGVSAIYKGSVVSYSNEAKVEILGVGQSSLQLQGAVSQVVAQEMAQGVRHRFHTDWGVSITGIAGPTGGSKEKPVGTVWIAVSGASFANGMDGKFTSEFAQNINQTMSKGQNPGNHNSSKLSESFVEARQYFFKGDRKQIQEQSVQAGFELLMEALENS